MGLRASPLRAAMRSMTARLRPTGDLSTQVGLGWRVTTLDGHAIVWSNGRADGFRSFIGYSTATRVGVVALANVGGDAGADDIAEHLIDAYFPMKLQGPDDHHEIALAAAALARFVGRYQFDDHSVLTVRQDGLLLVATLSGQSGSFVLHAEASAGFFLREVDAQASFEGVEGAPAEVLVWHQNGHRERALRLP